VILARVIGLLFSIEALFLGVHLANVSAPYDDAFITLRYARNFAEGHGFVYNAGESLLGTSSPFYGLILGLLSRLSGQDPLWFANWLSAVALAAAGWFAFRIVLEDFDPFSAVVAGVSVAINPLLVFAWGGEWLIAIAVMAAGFFYYQTGRLPVAAVAFSIAVLLRGEALIGVVVVLAHAIWTRREGLPAAILIGGAIAAVWAGVLWSVTGHVLPTTFASKMAIGESGLFQTFLNGFRSLARQFVLADSRVYAFVALAGFGTLIAARRQGVWLLIGAWILLHVAFYQLLRMPFYHWYLVPVAFGLSLAAGAGVAAVQACALLVKGRSRVARGMALVVAGALSAAMLWTESGTTRYWISIKPTPSETLYDDVGKWLAANTAADASVSYVEIGRIGYYSRRPIVDLMGLVTPGASRKAAEREFGWAVNRYKPAYYISCNAIGWADEIRQEPWFSTTYSQAATFASVEGTRLTIYRKQADAQVPEPLDIEPLQTTDGAVVGEIVGSRAHSQTFRAGRSPLAAISTRLGTFNRVNRGQMEFVLEELEPARVIYQTAFEMSDVADNLWRRFQFPPIQNSSGRMFRFSIRPKDSARGNAITIWYNPKDVYQAGEHQINGASAPGDLTVKLIYAAP
jgi:hypothetical protein